MSKPSFALTGGVGCIGCLGFLAFYVAIGAFFAWVIEWTWNTLAPTLWHGPHISYAVACAIYIALSLLVAVFL